LIYLDTSFVAPLLLPESSSANVERVLTGLAPGEAAVSSWTRTEFASAVARRVRIGEMDAKAAHRAVRALDELIERSFRLLAPMADDFNTAHRMIVDSDWQLRAGDALHLAIARAWSARAVLTLDASLLRIARRLGVAVGRGLH
jgi:predicted nucleic acid-binding protein